MSAVEQKTHTTPLDSRSAYEIATTGRPDKRDEFTVALDVFDVKVPEVEELYRRLGLFEGGKHSVYDLTSVMEMLKEGIITGVRLEQEEPGFLDQVIDEEYPQELAKTDSAER